MSKKIQFFEDKDKTKQIYPEIEIFEMGSNDNGNYIKFDNGLLICYGRKTYKNMSFSNDFWTNYKRSENGLYVDFPVQFIEKPYCLLTGAGNTLWIIQNEDNLSTSRSQGCTAISPNGYSASRDVILVYYAIGKWK